jgi:hypothetical protein
MNSLASRATGPVVPVMCACVLGIAVSAAAQNVATITGVVKDPQALAIPGATVTLSNRVSRGTQNTVSDEVGRYTLANIPYGTYVLAVSLPGFTPVEEVVEIRSSVPLVKDVELKIGPLSETVNVSRPDRMSISARI